MFLIISFLFVFCANFLQADNIAVRIITSPEVENQSEGYQSNNLPQQRGIWIDSNHSIYSPHITKRSIRKITQSGNIFSVTTSSNIRKERFPTHVVGDSSKNVLYINDGQQIWKHHLHLNNTDHFAGSLTSGFAGDGGPAIYCRLNRPSGMWFASSGELFIVDTNNHRIRTISIDNRITTIVGSISSNAGGYSGDGGFATLGELDSPTSVYVDSEEIFTLRITEIMSFER
jgi:hypothetical protein